MIRLGSFRCPGWRRAALLAAAVAVVGACNGGDDDASPTTSGLATTTTPTSVATTATTAAEVEAEVTTAYLAYWDMYLRVNDPPNPDDPQIQQLTTGPALPALLEIINANLAQGFAIRAPGGGAGEHVLSDMAVDGDTASLQDCVVDNLVVIRVTDGTVVNDNVATKLLDATLVREGGSWKVSDYIFSQRWEGVAGCAVAS